MEWNDSEDTGLTGTLGALTVNAPDRTVHH
jgi:hypothetical protein